jgi:hypothetical protein
VTVYRDNARAPDERESPLMRVGFFHAIDFEDK